MKLLVAALESGLVAFPRPLGAGLRARVGELYGV